MRLLAIAIVVEALRLVAVKGLYPAVPLVILVLLFLVCALLLVRFVAALRFRQIGLYPWREWTPVEKSYFIQLLVLANIVFPFIFSGRLRLIWAQPAALSIIWNGFVPYLFFGFYQEVVYRGMVQSELVRRWGGVQIVYRKGLIDSPAYRLNHEEVIKCFEEGVIESSAAANIGSIMGIGFPPNTGGAAQFMTGYEAADGRIGLQAFLDRADELAETYGERFRPTAYLRDLAARGEGFPA